LPWSPLTTAWLGAVALWFFVVSAGLYFVIFAIVILWRLWKHMLHCMEGASFPDSRPFGGHWGCGFVWQKRHMVFLIAQTG
jgi:sterol desaturase/sphingolipid hydroxylase (fatty acid hydroxylase superfamily)